MTHNVRKYVEGNYKVSNTCVTDTYSEAEFQNRKMQQWHYRLYKVFKEDVKKCVPKEGNRGMEPEKR